MPDGEAMKVFDTIRARYHPQHRVGAELEAFRNHAGVFEALGVADDGEFAGQFVFRLPERWTRDTDLLVVGERDLVMEVG